MNNEHGAEFVGKYHHFGFTVTAVGQSKQQLPYEWGGNSGRVEGYGPHEVLDPAENEVLTLDQIRERCDAAGSKVAAAQGGKYLGSSYDAEEEREYCCHGRRLEAVCHQCQEEMMTPDVVALLEDPESTEGLLPCPICEKTPMRLSWEPTKTRCSNLRCGMAQVTLLIRDWQHRPPKHRLFTDSER